MSLGSGYPKETIDNIFQPNNHSRWAIEFNDVEEAVSGKITRLINSHYHHIALEVLSVQRFRGTEISSHNYKVKLKGKCDDIFCILMRSHKEFGLEFVKTVIRACDYLSDHGCKTPFIIRDYQLESVVEFEGERYTAYRFIEGTQYQGNVRELISVASELARLDKALLAMGHIMNTEMFNKPDQERGRLEEFSREIWEDLISRARNRRIKGVGDYFDAVVIDAAGYIFEAIEAMDSFENDSLIQLVHSDLHPHNIITNGQVVLAFVDFDSLRFWERMRAVSFAIHRLVLQYLVNNNVAIVGCQDVIKFARDVFIANYDTINPLSEKETVSVGYFIQHEALRRATWVAKNFYLNGVETWKMAIYKQIRSLLEAKYFIS